MGMPLLCAREKMKWEYEEKGGTGKKEKKKTRRKELSQHWSNCKIKDFRAINLLEKKQIEIMTML